jgi:phage major head subunit gpT-like protein
MLINGANLAVAQQENEALFRESIKKTTPKYAEACMMTSCTGNQKTYHLLDELQGVTEWLGPRLMNELRANSVTLVDKKWTDAVRVARTDYEDDNWGLIKARFADMGKGFALHPDELLAALIKAGETDNAYDGVPFFSANHPTSTGTQSSLYNSALSRTVFEAAYAQHLQRTDYWGKPLGSVPTHLFYGPSLWATVRNILEVPTIFEATYAGDNPNKGLVKPVMLPNLDNASWMLADLSNGIKPFIFQERVAVEFAAQDQPNDDCVVYDDEYRYFGRARYAMGYGMWQFVTGYNP